MAILRADTESFRVHDHHSIMSPTALPVWLPGHILQRMVDRFRDHLRDELAVMFEETKRKARRRIMPPPSSLSRDDGDFFRRTSTAIPILHLAL
jgi:hypothetical protein